MKNRPLSKKTAKEKKARVLNDDPTGPVVLTDSLSSAGRKLCRDLVTVLRSGAPGAITGENPEHVHRMRVASRKLRIVLRFWSTQIDKKKAGHLVAELRWLAGLLGAARDSDILGMRFEAQWKDGLFSEPFKEDIRRCLRKKGDSAKAALSAELASARFEQLLLSIERLFSPAATKGPEPRLCETVPQFFRFAVRKAGRYAGRKLDYSELHSLRIAFKRLRYLVEFFGALYPRKLAGCLRAFRKYQETLGTFCDAHVSEVFLTSLLSGSTAGLPEAQQRHIETGGLIYIQRLDAEQQYRRFEKKRNDLPRLLKAVRRQTKRL